MFQHSFISNTQQLLLLGHWFAAVTRCTPYFKSDGSINIAIEQNMKKTSLKSQLSVLLKTVAYLRQL